MPEESVAIRTSQGNEYYVPKSVAASGSYNGEQIVSASGLYNSSTGTTSIPPPIPQPAPQNIAVRNDKGEEYYRSSDQPITPEQGIVEVLIPGAGPGGGAYVEKAPQGYVLTSPGWKVAPQSQNVQTAPREMTDFQRGLLGLPDFTPKEKTMNPRESYISGVISKNELQAAEAAQGGEVIYTVPVDTLAVAKRAQTAYPVVSETHSPLSMAQATAERAAINEEERQKNIYASAQSPIVQAGYIAHYANPINAGGILIDEIGPRAAAGTWDAQAQHETYMNYVQGLSEKEPEVITGTFEFMGKPVFTANVPFDSREALMMGVGLTPLGAELGVFGNTAKVVTRTSFNAVYALGMGLSIGETIKDPSTENVARTGIYAAIPFVGYGLSKGVPKVISWIKGGNPKPPGGNPKPPPPYVEAAKSDVILDTTGTTATAYTKTMTADGGRVATSRIKSQLTMLDTEFGTKKVYGLHEVETTVTGSAKRVKSYSVTKDEMVVKRSDHPEGIGDIAIGTAESKTIQLGIRSKETAAAGFFESVKRGQVKAPEGEIYLYDPKIKGEPARVYNIQETYGSAAYGVQGKKGVIFSEVSKGSEGTVLQMDAAFVGESARRGVTIGKTDVYSLMEGPKKSAKFEPDYGLFEQRGEVSSPPGNAGKSGLETELMGDSMQKFVQGTDQAKMLGFESGRAAVQGGQKSKPNMMAVLLPESKGSGRKAPEEKDAFEFAFGMDVKQQSRQEQRAAQDIDVGLGLGLKMKPGTDFKSDTSRDMFVIPLGTGLGLNQDTALSLELKAGQMSRARMKRGQAPTEFDFGFGRGKQPSEKFFAPPPPMRGMELFKQPRTGGGRKKKRGYYYVHKNPVMSAEEFLGFGSKRGRKRR